MGLKDWLGELTAADGLMALGISSALYGAYLGTESGNQLLNFGIIVMLLAFLLIFAEETG